MLNEIYHHGVKGLTEEADNDYYYMSLKENR